jgi:hypothetical protein
MELFFDWINHDDQTPPILKAGIAHLWLVMIHPFDDGNGRICRATRFCQKHFHCWFEYFQYQVKFIKIKKRITRFSNRWEKIQLTFFSEISLIYSKNEFTFLSTKLDKFNQTLYTALDKIMGGSCYKNYSAFKTDWLHSFQEIFKGVCISISIGTKG